MEVSTAEMSNTPEMQPFGSTQMIKIKMYFRWHPFLMSLLQHEFKALGKQAMERASQKGYFTHSRLFHTCLPFEADSHTAKDFLRAILVTQSTNSTCFTDIPTKVC